ncbi:hypothetical protein M5D96_005882 [Drosophila gunungcola]|uniref:Uncharacterized protein n=1 Tax=Drosophila gunungcola TaxID=103775 RepID=A0A9Q0BR73_9MUSC|nr:hypothetical protein M5D96_005882 [Drosophila gunungcola]
MLGNDEYWEALRQRCGRGKAE